MYPVLTKTRLKTQAEKARTEGKVYLPENDDRGYCQGHDPQKGNRGHERAVNIVIQKNFWIYNKKGKKHQYKYYNYACMCFEFPYL